jgi:hypothetical protein
MDERRRIAGNRAGCDRAANARDYSRLNQEAGEIAAIGCSSFLFCAESKSRLTTAN